MWCKRPWFIYIVVGLVAGIASAAPSEKREGNANEKQFVKVEIDLLPKDKAHEGVGVGGGNDDTEYYPTIDVSVNETSHEHPAASSNNKPKGEGKGGFKTICEDEGPGSKCSEETIDQLISKIKAICEEQESKELRELADKLAGKVHELQNSCGGEASKGRHLSGVVHKHTVEQEVVKIEEHEEDDGSEAKEILPLMPENVPERVPPVPVVATPRGPPTIPTLSYLEEVPADVNFNGGMNQPIDVLKQLYPDGHWPDEPEKAGVNSAESGVAIASPGMSSDDTSSNLEAALQVHVDSNPKEEDKEEYYDDNYDYNSSNNDSSLTPEYLESIIRIQQPSLQTENHQQKQHHVQEHELPMDD